MWLKILRYAAGHRGYTHQWQRADFDAAAWAPLVMASADSIDQAAHANLLGMRVFRVSIGVDKQAGERYAQRARRVIANRHARNVPFARARRFKRAMWSSPIMRPDMRAA
jgi:hypothetical protein